MTIKAPYLTLACLVTANIAAVFWLFLYPRIIEGQGNGLKAIIGAPAFGDRIIPPLSDRPWLVQLVDPRDERALQAVNEVSRMPQRQPFNWVVVTADPDSLLKNVPIQSSRVYLLRMELSTAKRLFELHGIGGRWLLYDSLGSLRVGGTFEYGGLAGELSALLDGRPRFSAQLVAERLVALDSDGVFSALHQAAREARMKQNVVLFVRRASTGCRIEVTIREFEVAATKETNSAFAIVVPATWSSNEIEAFKTNLDISTPVVVANSKLTSAWELLADQYGSNLTTGFVAVFTTDGIATVEIDPARVSGALRRIHYEN
jgi:hypothetical protein